MADMKEKEVGEDASVHRLMRHSVPSMAFALLQEEAEQLGVEVQEMLDQGMDVRYKLECLQYLQICVGLAQKYASYDLYTTDFSDLSTTESKVERAIQIIKEEARKTPRR